MYSFIFRLGMSGEFIIRLRVSISWITIRSSSDLDRASPIDLIRSRNCFDWLNPPWEPIASSRPIVFNCSRLRELGFWICRFSRLGVSEIWGRLRLMKKKKVLNCERHVYGTWLLGLCNCVLDFLLFTFGLGRKFGFTFCVARWKIKKLISTE